MLPIRFMPGPDADAPRVAAAEPCEIEGSPSRTGTVWNLSVRGLYVVIEPPPPLGARVRISFALPHEKKPVKAEARIAWCNPGSSRRGRGAKVFGLPPGCGLEFVSIDAADLERINRRVMMTPVLRRRPRPLEWPTT
jgi:hypothetical protein